MKKIMIKKIADKKRGSRFAPRTTIKPISESQFWKRIALEQQIILHAKNST